jgi:hypothetical protein
MNFKTFKLILRLVVFVLIWHWTLCGETIVFAEDGQPPRNLLIENYDETGRKLPPGVPKYVDTNGVLLSINHHFTTPEYQREALRLIVQEANKAAKELNLVEQLPITQSNLATFHISPFGFAYGNKMMGFVETENYSYYVACNNKLNHVDIANYDKVCFKLKDRGLLQISELDTNTAFHLATNWLNKLSIDVAGLNRDCVAHVAVSPFWNNLANLGDQPQKKFVPFYYVWWTYPGEPLQGNGGAAEVELYEPTKKLLGHFRVMGGFVSGVNQSLGFLGVVGAKAFALFGLGVEAVISVADSAIN